MIDSHVHLRWPSDIQNLDSVREAIGAERMCIASVADRRDINDNPALFAAKAAFPDRFYLFPALDHSTQFSSGAVQTPSFVEQVERAVKIGADGLKLIESKPTHRRMMETPIDSEDYESMFAQLEETGLPILWHVADPEEFWHPELTPSWAAAKGWGYDERWTPKEAFYEEVSSVLQRHPRLKVIFAHFYFLSADLPRAATLLDRYEGVHLDLAPGIEMLYNMSKHPEAARDFFIKYARRIIYGTDIEADHTLDQARKRAGIVKRWLSSDDEYRVPDGADYTLGPSEDGIIRGLNLPADVQAGIYSGNIQRLVGAAPRPLDISLALDECRRIAREAEVLGADATAVRQAEQQLSALL